MQQMAYHNSAILRQKSAKRLIAIQRGCEILECVNEIWLRYRLA